MLGELQKLLRKQDGSAPIISTGWHRKRSYMKWNCASCSHTYFYAVARCPVCESADIKQTIHELNQNYKDVVEVVE